MRDSLLAGGRALIRDSSVRWGLASILSIGLLVTNSPGQGSLLVREVDGARFAVAAEALRPLVG